VDFAPTTGLQSSVGGTTQSTGPGQVVLLSPAYASTFADEVRVLAGADTGALLLQQTASNLRAQPGDTIEIGRPGLPAATVVVTGVVDLPHSDTLFQRVGAPAGAQPSAPPANVVLLSPESWSTVVGPLAAARPDLVRHQVHVRLDHRLAADPARAFAQVTGHARNFEAKVAGAGLVGNNLAAALDGARSDALYAQALFLLLGLPGAVLAGLLVRAVAAAGRDRRRRELALLRARGASRAVLVRLAAGEAALVAVTGGAVGLAAASVIGRVAFSSATFGTTRASALLWGGAAAATGAVIVVAAVLAPAWREASSATVTSTRVEVGRPGRPLALRWGLDLWVLGAAALLLWLTARNGYNLVLAPEGVPTLSVSYWSLGGPLLLWVGAGLVAWRASDAVLGRGRRALEHALRPAVSGLAGPVAASL